MFYICGEIITPRTAKVEKQTHKNKYMKQIKVTPDERKSLQERFHVGDNYMLDVLSFRKDGPTARKIRRAALQLGGRYVDPEFVPNCTTQYVGGYIVQTFAENVILRINKHTGDIELSHNGEIVDSIKNASMALWNAMAHKAQDVAESQMVIK